jgi:YHS domain-containing protein
MKFLPAMTVFLVMVTTACTGVAAPPADPVRVNPHGIGIDGYSPVSYFTEGKPQRGDPAFSATHDGITYHFTDAQQVDLFEQDPTRYLPAHGGWCTLMMGGSGRRTPGHPESFVIVDDRLMLFWSGDTEQTRGMGLMNWGRKTHGDPDAERKPTAIQMQNVTISPGRTSNGIHFLRVNANPESISTSPLMRKRLTKCNEPGPKWSTDHVVPGKSIRKWLVQLVLGTTMS